MSSDQSSLPLVGNRFQIHDPIGAGGMGTVYRATNIDTREIVAVKVLKPEAVDRDPGLIERFRREADALRQLNHPNIVKVLAAFDTEGHHYIVMEYVRGGSLHDLLKRVQPDRLPINRIVSIALELADALSRAHHLKIVHRDIKPANVLIAEDGSPRLTDFGVAQFGTKERVTQSGLIIGTPDYLSWTLHMRRCK